MPRPLAPPRPSFSLRAPTFLVTHIGTSRHTPRHLLPRVRALLAPHVPAVCSPPRAARSPAGAKPTAVGKARICVSKTSKYSIKRRKLLYFFAFFKVLSKKIPLNSRGGKIPQVFLSSCSSETISRFSGGKRTPLRAFRPPLFGGTRARFSRALLITLFLFLILFLPATLVSEPPCPRKRKAPRHAGLCSFLFVFLRTVAPSPTADAFLPAMV